MREQYGWVAYLVSDVGDKIGMIFFFFFFFLRNDIYGTCFRNLLWWELTH